MPESVAVLPIIAELVIDDTAAEAPPAVHRSYVVIVVGCVVIRACDGVDESQLTRAIQ